MELRICVLLVEMLLALSIISSLELLSAQLPVQLVSISMLAILILVKLATQIVLDAQELQQTVYLVKVVKLISSSIMQLINVF